MVARRVALALLVLLSAWLLVQGAAAPGGRPQYKGPLGIAFDSSGRFAYVALHRADALAVVDLKEGRAVAEVPVGRKPYDVALLEAALSAAMERSAAPQ